MQRAAGEGIPVPAVMLIDVENNSLYMQHISPSFTVKEFILTANPGGPLLDNMALQIGKYVAQLHDGQCIHGDLTTSNLLI